MMRREKREGNEFLIIVLCYFWKNVSPIFLPGVLQL